MINSLITILAQIVELERIFKKHGMMALEIEEQIKVRKSGYLGQALYFDDEGRRIFVTTELGS